LTKLFFGYTLENVFQSSSDWVSLMAAVSLASIPTIVFFLFAQKYMIQSVVAGTVKGQGIRKSYSAYVIPLEREKEAIDDASPQLIKTYRLLCGLSSHDLSAMRELLGMPKVSLPHDNGVVF
jgi:hypothetical protein